MDKLYAVHIDWVYRGSSILFFSLGLSGNLIQLSVWQKRQVTKETFYQKLNGKWSLPASYEADL